METPPLSDELLNSAAHFSAPTGQQSVVIVHPLLVPVKQACAIIGRGQSALYDLLGRGEIEAKKSDGRTLIVYESLRKYADRLPKATIAPPRQRKPQRMRLESNP